MSLQATGRRLAVIAPPFVLLALLVAGWEWAVAHYDVDPTILPAPSRVVEQGWEFRDQIIDNAIPTLRATAVGFAFSLLVATVLAVVMDFSRIVRRAVYPLLVASQTLPIIAIAPLFIIWFGFDLLPKVLIVALVTFFPITVSLVSGFDSTDPEATRLLRSMGASRIFRFLHLRLPSAGPQFFAGLRIAVTYAVVAAIFAEYAGAEKGLGIYMALQKNSARTDLVLATVAVTAILSIALFALTYLLEAVTIPWYRASRRESAKRVAV